MCLNDQRSVSEASPEANDMMRSMPVLNCNAANVARAALSAYLLTGSSAHDETFYIDRLQDTERCTSVRNAYKKELLDRKMQLE
jgi:hypothetical protein